MIGTDAYSLLTVSRAFHDDTNGIDFSSERPVPHASLQHDLLQSVSTEAAPFADAIGSTIEALSNRILIKFTGAVDDVEAAIGTVLDAGSYAIDFIADAFEGVVSLNLNDIDSALAIETFEQSGLVDMVVADHMVGLHAAPDVTVEAVDPGDDSFFRQYPHQQMEVQEAWDLSRGDGVVVAVLDTGTDFDHADLRDNLWTNAGEIAGNGLDDDGNGFIDDIHGWDFVNNDNDASDDNGHGTMVAGIIAATADNGVGVAGIAPDAQIMTLKFMGSNGYGYWSNAIKALDYAVANGATISNNSYGGIGAYSASFLDAILATRADDHVFVAAAGNDALNIDYTPVYPASFASDNIITVAATDQSNNLAYFSNYGQEVDIAAAGIRTYTTYHNGDYIYFNGTSAAAPHVAATVALVQSLHPDWSYQQVIEAVLETANPAGNLGNKVATGGLVNANDAVHYNYTQPADPDPTPGDGPSTPAPIFDRARGVYHDVGEFIMTDMNGDGVADMVSLNSAYGGMVWHSGTDLYNVTRVLYGDTGGQYALGDMNGDGIADLVTTKMGGLGFYDGTGVHAFNRIFYHNPGDFHLADMNNDGQLDILSLNSGYGGVVWYETNGTVHRLTYNTVGKFGVGDFDGDGQNELISAGGAYQNGTAINGVVYYDLNGAMTRYGYMDVFDFTVGNFDGDAADEILTNATSITQGGVVINPGHIMDRITYNDLGDYTLGDIDGDGVDEIVTASSRWSNGDLVGGLVAYELDGTMIRISYQTPDDFQIAHNANTGLDTIVVKGGEFGNGTFEIGLGGSAPTLIDLEFI